MTSLVMLWAAAARNISRRPEPAFSSAECALWQPLRSLLETSDAFRAENNIVRVPHPPCGYGSPPSNF
jgi:hypothetical protein